MSQEQLQAVMSRLTDEELMALQAGDMSKLSDASLMALQSVMGANAPAPTFGPLPEPDTQRLRTMAQGASMGSSDEIEAALRSLLPGQTFEGALQDVRGKLSAYKESRPVESLAYETGGAMLPGLAMAPFTGGSSLGVTVPSLARVAAVSGAQGGITGFNTGEGDFIDRLSRVPAGVATGAIGGPAAQTLVKAGGGLVNGVIDFARRRFGDKPARAVEVELQRLASESGMTTDEIINSIASGSIMAENATLREAVRGLYTKGGAASTTIGRLLSQRPQSLREQSMRQMQQGLAPGSGQNVYAARRFTEQELADAESLLYNQAFEQGGVVTKPLLDAFSTSIQRSPEARKKVNELLMSETGNAPFYRLLRDGSIEYTRTPTIQDMEIARRGIQDTVNKRFAEGSGEAGRSLKRQERSLRGFIDESSSAVGTARSTAAANRSANEAFQEGRRALSRSADEVSVMFSDMTPGQVSAFRSGLMDALRTRSMTGSRNSMISNLANENMKEGQILRTVFPGDQLDNVLQTLNLASNSQAAASRILGGSPTAASLAQGQRIGMNIAPEEVSEALTGNVMAGYRVLRKLVGTSTQNLTDQQRDQVARILVSQDPQVVSRALRDTGGLAALQEVIRGTVARMSSGAASGVTQIGAGRAQQQTQR